jgi:hypothetical protein
MHARKGGVCGSVLKYPVKTIRLNVLVMRVQLLCIGAFAACG